MSKRMIALLLAGLLAATALTGCKGSESSPGSDASAGGTSGADLDDGVPEMNLNGYEFVIADAYHYEQPNMEPGSSDLTDAVLERNKTIEKRFNCKITYQYYEPTGFYNEVYPILMSGEKLADVMIPTLFNYGKFAVADYLGDLGELPYLKLDEEYWIDLYNDAAVSPDGKRLGASSYMANPYQYCFGLYFNKRLISELNLQNPYDLLAEGKWNWENFGQLLDNAMKDVDNNAVFDGKDIYSITGGLDGGITAFFMANGQHMFKMEDNLVKYAMTDEGVIPTLTTLKDMFSAPGCYYYGGGDSQLCTQMFMDGQVTFFMNLMNRGDRLRDMKDDYGFLPIPMGPNVDQFYSPIDHNTPIICVPSTGIDNPEATGAILQAMACASYKEKDIWEEEVAGLYYRDDESFVNLTEHVLPSMTFDPVFMYSRLAQEFEMYTITAIYKPVARDPAADAATIINEGKEVVQTMIDELINKTA